MSKKFQSSVDYLFKKKGDKRGTENVKALLGYLGPVDGKYKIVHVAGTNGKGSVATYLAKILEFSGYNVGLFTSPHVDKFTERIRVNSKEISEDFVIDFIDNVKKLPVNSTFFEINTVMALKYFEKLNVDIAVVEVGVGGRFDSTNVVAPFLTLITSIDIDHEKILGSRIEGIAYEKGGIIKPKIPVIVGKVPSEALKVLEEIAFQNNAEIILFGKDFWVTYSDGLVFNFKYGSSEFKNLCIKLPGDHIRHNVSLSIVAALFFDRVNEMAIRRALLNNNILPARSELTLINGYNILFDVCHNTHGAKAFSEMIKKYFYSYEKIYIFISILRTKRFNEMIKEFLRASNNCIVSEMDFEKSFNSKDISGDLRDKIVIIENYNIALEYILNKLGKNDLLCIVGSFYFIDRIRKILNYNQG